MSHPKQARLDLPIQSILSERWSPYAFDERPVAATDLAALFEAARWAPSSYNEQPWRYLVARREERDAFAKLASCLVDANRAWAERAPVLALGVAVTRLARTGAPNRAALHDLGLAAGNLCAEATARGLSVHQMIGIHPERARELYAIPEGSEALTGLAIGYRGDPAGLPERLRQRDEAPRTRRPLEAFVFADRWEAPAAFLASAPRRHGEPAEPA
jgi:nitroreductase